MLVPNFVKKEYKHSINRSTQNFDRMIHVFINRKNVEIFNWGSSNTLLEKLTSITINNTLNGTLIKSVRSKENQLQVDRIKKRKTKERLKTKI